MKSLKKFLEAYEVLSDDNKRIMIDLDIAVPKVDLVVKDLVDKTSVASVEALKIYLAHSLVVHVKEIQMHLEKVTTYNTL